MKSTISVLIPEKPVKPFPKLMIFSPDNNTIVLMSRERYGMVIYSTDKAYPVGYVTDDWSVKFEDYDGSVTLSND